MVKNLPAVQVTWISSLGGEDSPGEGNGNPLQYSCLKNPMDRGAWQASKESDTAEQRTLSHFHAESDSGEMLGDKLKMELRNSNERTGILCVPLWTWDSSLWY